MTKSACAGLVVLLLASCGGGGGGSSSGSTSTTSTAAVKRVSVGDVYTYSRTDTTVGGAASSYLFSREYLAANPDGTSTDVETFSNQFVATLTNVSAVGGVTETSLKNTPTSKCTYSPESIGAPYPYQAGKSWDNAWNSTCGAVVSKGTNKGSIVGTESVTVAAGTFNALKEVYVVTSQPTSPASDQVTTTDITCWRDVDLKQYVKCEYATRYSLPSAAGTDALAKTVVELQNYMAAGAAKTMPSPSRYAGTWIGRYYGDEFGSCDSVTITAAGAISGSCEGMVTGKFTVSGTVDAQGNTTLTRSGGGVQAIFTGQFRSITEIVGTWSSGQAVKGYWAMYHN